jgi:23S rRNA pseudouridine1911/1915/1917 synthase
LTAQQGGQQGNPVDDSGGDPIKGAPIKGAPIDGAPLEDDFFDDGEPVDPEAIDVRHEVGREHHRLSLFDFLDALCGPIDRKLLNAAAKDGLLKLNDEPAGPAVTLRTGDSVTLSLPLADLARKPDFRVELLQVDDELLVASKPSGLAFDASRSGSGNSAIERLTVKYGEGARLRPLHRLDKDTSGIVLAALSREAEERLGEVLRRGQARVEYLAMVRGTVKEDEGFMDLPLGKRRRSDAKLVPDPKHGRLCRTSWTVEERLRGFTWLRLWSADTGRSHQIRAHLASAGHPALCDKLYGEDDRILLSQLKLGYRPRRGKEERPILARPALHATCFRWDERVVEAPLADDLEVLVAQLRRHRPVT